MSPKAMTTEILRLQDKVLQLNAFKISWDSLQSLTPWNLQTQSLVVSYRK